MCLQTWFAELSVTVHMRAGLRIAVIEVKWLSADQPYTHGFKGCLRIAGIEAKCLFADTSSYVVLQTRSVRGCLRIALAFFGGDCAVDLQV